MRQNSSIEGFRDVFETEVMIVAAWYLWWIRRKRTHNESIPPLHRCRMSILSITANAAKCSSQVRTSNSDKRRIRPSIRQVKINVDGSFHSDAGAGAIGAIARDFEGRFIAASTNYLPTLASAAAAEAMALREGLTLAIHMGCNNIQVESDSTETIQAFTGDAIWWGESSAVYADCIDLKTQIGSVQVQYCPREANEVAHELARNCFAEKSSCNWVDEPPSFIVAKLVNDVTTC